MKPDFDVVIIGGGLAGLVSASMLSGKGYSVLLAEKKKYPFHKVCGEYVSNEVLGFLKHLGFDPHAHGASSINRLRISTPSGKNYFSQLDLGGFGISRYILDHALSKLAMQKGVELFEEAKATDVVFNGHHFVTTFNNGKSVTSKLVIGSYGKRDTLDKKLNREFIRRHTNFMAVKYHVRIDYPVDEIGLDNFPNGYCGIVKIEEDKYNLCYLFHRQAKHSIKEIEKNFLFTNPQLRKIFEQSNFLEEPQVINEISFAKKQLIEDHQFMCGDSAGLITPLCGNGMSMAIHGAKILSELIITSGILSSTDINMLSRLQLEKEYFSNWNKQFGRRLSVGRILQQLIIQNNISAFSIPALHAIPSVKNWFIRQTHGKPIMA